MIQHTARPESAAPVENADTAATTNRFKVTRLSGSSIKLSRTRPERETEREKEEKREREIY